MLDTPLIEDGYGIYHRHAKLLADIHWTTGAMQQVKTNEVLNFNSLKVDVLNHSNFPK